MSVDYAIGLLSEKDCSDCMRCNGIWITKQSILNDDGAWSCKKGFKAKPSRSLCKHFLYRKNIWSRVYFSLRTIIPFLLIVNTLKYIFNKPSMFNIVIDILVIVLNIFISYFMNKRVLKHGYL